MPKVEVDAELEELAEVLAKLTPGELETLEIMLNSKLKTQIKSRWSKAKEELKRGKTLSKEELFAASVTKAASIASCMRFIPKIESFWLL